MKKIIFSVLILWLAACSFSSEKTNEVYLGKVKFLSKTSYDFGEVKNVDETLSYVFSFQNVDKNPLKLEVIKTDCACTRARYEFEDESRNPSAYFSNKEEEFSVKINPEEKFNVRVVYDPAYGDTRNREIERSVEFFTSAGKDPVVLKLKANLILE